MKAVLFGAFVFGRAIGAGLSNSRVSCLYPFRLVISCNLFTMVLHSYEDWDEYEEDGEEQQVRDEGVEYDDEEGEEEEEEEEEEERKPSKEELEYLEMRERLKANLRKRMKKESGSNQTTSADKAKKLPYDNYGSFFGPSQPVIAPRVIEQSKSLLEMRHLASKISHNPHSAPKVSNSSHSNKPAPTTSTSQAKATSTSQAQARISASQSKHEIKVKVQKLKDTRDYSFLLSDDADLPAPPKEPPPRPVSAPKSEARASQVQLKSRPSSSNSVRQVTNGGRDDRKVMAKNTESRPRSGPQKSTAPTRPNSKSVDPRNQIGSSKGNGPGRPVESKQVGGNKGNGPARPLDSKSIPSKHSGGPTLKRPMHAPAKGSMQRADSSKLQQSLPKRPLEQRKEVHSDKAKYLSKQPAPLLKPQIKKPPPPKQIPSRPSLPDNRPKKKPVKRYSDDEEDDEAGNAISMIRNMFGYNPRKYNDAYDDDSDMEANFDDILREEKRSAMIAREEDERELRLIEEEERRERMRKEAKKRKLSNR